jgi:hypothetical protein
MRKVRCRGKFKHAALGFTSINIMVDDHEYLKHLFELVTSHTAREGSGKALEWTCNCLNTASKASERVYGHTLDRKQAKVAIRDMPRKSDHV